VPVRVQFTNGDRLFFPQFYRCFPSIVKAHHLNDIACVRTIAI
jgi:hypothetical protein